MSLPIVFRMEAQSEFDQAFDWYESKQPGLGIDLLNCVAEALKRIELMPESSVQVFEDIRRAVVHRFPYSVFYRIEESQIVVLAVFHTKRDPQIWKVRV
jgi:plasmid stabilization system protein ParE